VAGMELWKFTKRTFHLLEDLPVKRGAWGQGSGTDSDGPRFRKAVSMSSFKTWASFSRKDTGESTSKYSTSRGGPVSGGAIGGTVPQGQAATEMV
jgi:Na+-exporting ATPase